MIASVSPSWNIAVVTPDESFKLYESVTVVW